MTAKPTEHPSTDRAFFGRRKGHPLRQRQTDLIANLLPRLALDLTLPPPANLASLFPEPPGEVRLEIGFGGGEYLAAEASANSHVGFIGCEPFLNGMAKGLALIEEGGLTNIRLHFADATELISWLPGGGLARVDLVHPDPWRKRRHWKRRFVQHRSIAEIARVLRTGGEFRFVTDWDDYAAWTLALFRRSREFEWTAEQADDWRSPWPGFVRTRYQTKALREGRAPCFLVFRRR